MNQVSALTLTGLLVLIGVRTPTPPPELASSCTSSTMKEALENEKSDPEFDSCNRERILDRFIERVELAANRAESAEQAIVTQSSRPRFRASITKTGQALDSLAGEDPQSESIADLVDQVKRSAQGFRAEISDIDLDTLDRVDQAEICESKIAWKKAKLWKARLEQCPPPTPAPPSPTPTPTPSDDSDGGGS